MFSFESPDRLTAWFLEKDMGLLYWGLCILR